jgi:hypothetical protein
MQLTETDATKTMFRLGVCAGRDEVEGRAFIQVEADPAEENLPTEPIPCLAGVSVRPGDRILLVPVREDPGWVAIGLVAEVPHPPLPAPAVLPASGFHLETEEAGGEDRVRFRAPDGTPHLEVRVVEGRIHLYFPAQDAVVECGGNLELRAGGTLRLNARDYELNLSGDALTRARGKIRTEAAEQELLSHTGPMRLKAKKNMVVKGQFILLNTDEEGWT